MAYNKKTWIDNEVITTDALNNIEDGILSIEENMPTKISQLANDSDFVSKDFVLDQLDYLNLRIIELEKIVNELTSTVPCTRVVIEETEISFTNLESTRTLTSRVEPANTTDIASWRTSNAKVAIVSNKGVVTPVGAGNCIIYLECGEQSVQCLVTVTIECSSVKLNKSSLSFSQASEVQIVAATLSPTNTTDKTVWTTSNAAVATVTGNGSLTGNVKAVGDGSCTITCTCGGKTATCTANVSLKVNYATMQLSTTEINLKPGASTTMKVTLMPENTSLDVGNIQVNSSNPSVTYSVTRTSQRVLTVSITMSGSNPSAGAINFMLGNQAESVAVYVVN